MASKSAAVRVRVRGWFWAMVSRSVSAKWASGLAARPSMAATWRFFQAATASSSTRGAVKWRWRSWRKASRSRLVERPDTDWV